MNCLTAYSITRKVSMYDIMLSTFHCVVGSYVISQDCVTILVLQLQFELLLSTLNFLYLSPLAK